MKSLILPSMGPRARRFACASIVALLAAAGAVTREISLQAQAGQGQEIPVVRPPAAAPDARVQVLIELTEEPGARAYARVLGGVTAPDAATRAAAAAAARTQIDRVGAQQTQVMGLAAAAGLQPVETFRVRRAMNGVAATVTNAQLAALGRLPGVKAVHRIEPEYPNNSTSVPFIGAPQLWNDSLGLGLSATGAGIRIGIIDTGIDYQHADFGGTGLLADYQANDRAAAPDAYFPSAKVVGGVDFAGDAYTGSNAPTPDADPMDCNGHGTHVAGTAAGYGVNADGSTYTGAYGPGTPFPAMRIGPGVAPQASLYALRVFGCGGSTGLTVQAIDWSMDPNGDNDLSDRLDVINMSLGSNFGSLASTSAIAADNAVAAGVIVVTSAGNAGDTFFIGGSPGSGNRVISTAASADAGLPGPYLRVNAPGGVAGNYGVGTAAFGPPPPVGGITGNVVLALDPADADGPLTTDACSALTNAAAIAGNIAFIDRGTCGFTIKTKRAQDAGAIAVILANSSAGAFGNLGGTDPTIVIPTVHVSFADGNALRAELGAGLNATLFSAADTIGSFSSRGPRLGSGAIQLKPDITAPGVAIVSAQTGVTCTASGCQTPDGTGFLAGSQPLQLQGTSMASPHVAGMMALLRQLHPTWTVEELKALAMNSAQHDLWELPGQQGRRHGPSRIGAGRVDVPLAAQSTVVAFNAENTGQVSASFEGAVLGSVTRGKTVRIVNHGVTDQTYDLAIDTVVDAPGVAFTVPSGSTVTVPAGQAVDLPIAMEADAAQMTHARDPLVAATQAAPAPLNSLGNVPRHWLTEEGSYLTFSQGGSLKLRVPLYVAATPASAMRAAPSIVTGGAPTGTTTIPLTGTEVCTGTLGAGPTCTGTYPNDEVSLVTPLELQVISPADPARTPGYADIQYAGVAYDATNDQLFFGISTWEPWTSPRDVTFNIYIDNNFDGTYDRVLYAADPGTQASALFGATGVSPQDTFTSSVFNLATNGVSLPATATNALNRLPPSVIDTRVFDNQVVFLAVPRNSLAVTGPFRYKVVTCPGSQPLCAEINGNRFDEAAGPYFWNYLAQGLDFGGVTLAQDLNGATLPVAWNVANLATNGSLGALLLHHHNRVGERAQVVALDGASTADLAITLAASSASPTPGDAVTLTYTVSNAGPASALGVQAFVPLPAGVTYISDDGAGTYDAGLGVWTISSLAPAGSATLHVSVSADGAGPLSASASVMATAPVDTNTANNYTAIGLTAAAQADLQITAVPVASPVLVGSSGTFIISVKNIGNDTAYNVSIATSLTGAATLTGGASSDGLFDPPSGLWRIASLPKDGTAQLALSVAIAAGPSVSVSATASSAIADPNALNNAAAATMLVDRRTTSSTLTLLPATPIIGEPATVTVTVADTHAGGAAGNPVGQVSFASTVAGDQLSSPTCTLAPVPATIDQSSCEISVTVGDEGVRTLTTEYLGSTVHASSMATQTVDVTREPTTTTAASRTVPRSTNVQTVPLTATVSGGRPIDGGTVTFTLKDSGNVAIGLPVVSAVLTATGIAEVDYTLPANTPGQTLTIVADYSGTPTLAPSSDATHTLTVLADTFTYLLSEGATGGFFDTDILLANPNDAPAPVEIRFLKEDGATMAISRTLLPTSRATIAVDTVEGLESASFSTVITSTAQLPLVVERTMRWDSTAYGSHTEKASDGSSTTWYFAEGSQGFFHTYFLLVNPQSTPSTAHITYVLEDATTVTHEYTLAPTSRLTVDAAAEPQLAGQSFGAIVTFTQPGMVERSVYFNHGGSLYAGGDASAGVMAPSTVWHLAEGATGSYFTTFLLIANPGAQPATATVRYLLDNGTEITKPHPIAAHQRLTLDAAAEDPRLATAAFSTVITSDEPLVVERSQYWPSPDWYEAHNSAAVAAPGQKWGLAEGAVGGESRTQTYILVANPNAQPAELTVTFLRADGTTVPKTFTVAPTSRFNIAIAGAGSNVPELADERFGTIIESTQPIVVERSMYSDANGVTWAAGTNATATRLP